ncbi:MAG: recombination protein RecR [Paludibacteraceae bacterium]|nr:recombination protein RecR [Paludibacteraceae bacterium]
MSDYPSILLEQAVNQMASLPGVGRKTALRLVLHLLRQSDQEVQAFSGAFTRLKQEVHYCRECHNISDTDLCPICSSSHRDHSTICVVENVQDVMSIENTGQYNGVYHVLGGIISPMDGVGPKDIEIDSLIERVAKGDIKEIILALPTTMEGDTTNFYIFRRIQNMGLTTNDQRPTTSLRISQIARGVAIGNELEYTDEITLGRSIVNRTDFKG